VSDRPEVKLCEFAARPKGPYGRIEVEGVARPLGRERDEARGGHHRRGGCEGRVQDRELGGKPLVDAVVAAHRTEVLQLTTNHEGKLPAIEVLRARAAGKSERFDSPSESPGKNRRQRCSLQRFYISVLGARTETSRPTRRGRASRLRAHQRERACTGGR
jgi:hypothetical protein